MVESERIRVVASHYRGVVAHVLPAETGRLAEAWRDATDELAESDLETRHLPRHTEKR